MNTTAVRLTIELLDAADTNKLPELIANALDRGRIEYSRIESDPVFAPNADLLNLAALTLETVGRSEQYDISEIADEDVLNIAAQCRAAAVVTLTPLAPTTRTDGTINNITEHQHSLAHYLRTAAEQYHNHAKLCSEWKHDAIAQQFRLQATTAERLASRIENAAALTITD